MAVYETLKSIGMQSVSNRELRLGIATVFNHYYERLVGEHKIDGLVTTEVLRPYYLRHFRDLRFWKSATPIDYEAVVSDTCFQNIVNYRLTVLRHNQLDSYAKAIAEIQTVLKMPDKELSME